MKRIQLSIDKIVQDESCQQRTLYDAATIDDYAEHLANGGTFPPLTVFHVGTVYVLADGHLRLRAYQRQGIKTVEVDVEQGSLRDAVLYSCGANAGHGAKRTSADIRRAIRRLLDDFEWGRWKVAQIATACKVSKSTVERVKDEIIEEQKPAGESEEGERGPQKILFTVEDDRQKARLGEFAELLTKARVIAEEEHWERAERQVEKWLDGCAAALEASV